VYKPVMTAIPEDEDELLETRKKKDFTFEGEAVQIDSLDKVHQHLVDQLGSAKVNKIYPVLRDFGDRILSEDNTELLIKALSPYLSRAEVRQYYPHLCQLVFFEKQAEDFGGGE
jgi:hypothetical protein